MKHQLYYLIIHVLHFIFYFYIGPGWLNELDHWIKQLVQAYHQYGVGSRPAL